VFDRFLTSGMNLADPETVRRVKTLNVFELVFVFASLVMGLFFLKIGAEYLFYAALIAALSGIGAMVVLRATHNIQLTGNIAVAVLWGFLVLVRWSSGGITPDGLMLLSWVWNGVLILLSIYICGYKWGALWSCLAFVESGLAVGLYRSGYDFTNVIPREISSAYSLMFYLLGLLSIFLFALLFERGREETRNELAEKTNMVAESRRYAEALLDSLTIPAFVIDSKHRIVEWNRACRDVTGLEPQDVIGQPVWEGFSLDENGSAADKVLADPEGFQEAYRESILSMTDSGKFEMESSLPRLEQGNYALVRVAPIRDQNGNIKGMLQTVEGIGGRTERRAVQAGSARNGLDGSLHPIFKVNSEFEISGWNRVCEDLLGFSSSAMLGQSPFTVVPKSYQKDFEETVSRALKGESVDHKEWRYSTSRGNSIYILAKVYPVKDAEGEIQECIVVNTDITELKLKMKQLGRSAVDSRDRLKKLTEEHNLLKRNIAAFIRKKEE